MSNRRSIFSGLFWKFSERIFAQLITFVVSIVLARLLTPSHYGSIALLNVFIAIANVFVISGLGNSLIQKKDADDLDFSSVFFFNIVISCLMYLILFILAPSISRFYNEPLLSPVLRILGLRLILAGVNSVQQAYVSKQMIFKKFFWATFWGSLISGVLGILAAYNGFGIWSLVIQNLSNATIDTIVLWFTVKWRPVIKFSIERIKLLFTYGWKLLVSALLDTGYLQLRSLIIGKVFTSSDLAFYNRGEQFPQLIVNNINASINTVLFPAISSVQDDRKKVKAMTRRAIKTSSFIMWPMMMGMIVLASPIVELVLTDKWLSSVIYMQIACIVYGFWPIHTANLQAIKAIGRSDVFLKLEVIKKTFGVLLIIFSIKFGVLAIAVSGIVSTIFSSFINAFPNKEFIDYGYMDQIRDIIPSFGLSVIMALIIYPFKYVFYSNILLIFIQVMTGTCVYILLSYLFKIESFRYLTNLLTNKK